MLRVVMLVGCMASLVGCWSGDELGMVPVRGTVTFNGSTPPADGRVSFSPMEPAAGKPSRPGNGKFSTDGRFMVTSFHDGDGLVPGRYSVKISCLKGNITETMSQSQIDSLPHVPSDIELPELVVEPDSDAVTYDIDVPMENRS